MESDSPRTSQAFKRARALSVHSQQMSHVASEMAKLERENAELRQCAAKLAVFAMAYRSHPKRNLEDELDSSLAQFEALIR